MSNGVAGTVKPKGDFPVPLREETETRSPVELHNEARKVFTRQKEAEATTTAEKNKKLLERVREMVAKEKSWARDMIVVGVILGGVAPLVTEIIQTLAKLPPTTPTWLEMSIRIIGVAVGMYGIGRYFTAEGIERSMEKELGEGKPEVAKK